MSLQDIPAIILVLAAGYLLAVYLLLILAQRTFKSSQFSPSPSVQRGLQTQSSWQGSQKIRGQDQELPRGNVDVFASERFANASLNGNPNQTLTQIDG